MNVDTVSIASDHGGFEQKQLLMEVLSEEGYAVIDRGCETAESVDYPDYAVPVANDVVDGSAQAGILVCGTGIGMAIAANKIDGIRAANAINVEFAKLSREHNDANIVTLSGRFVSPETNAEIVKAFLTTDFAGDRHERRVAKIMALQDRE